MKIYIAEEAGFCFGVKRALKLINQLYEKGNNIQIYGQLIHNSSILNDLQSKGIQCIESFGGLDPQKKVIIRTHGIAKDQEENLLKAKTSYEDVTCPLVKKLHNILDKTQKEKKQVIIVGDKHHPEIIAATSYCPTSVVINSLDDLKNIQKTDELSVLAQTTLDSDHYAAIVSQLIDKVEKLEVYNTICFATKARQKAIKELAPSVDGVIVIGGKNSSNTRKLYEIALKKNKNTFLVEESKHLLNPDILNSIKNFKTIGITAGASTHPDEIIEAKKILKKITIAREIKNGQVKRNSEH